MLAGGTLPTPKLGKCRISKSTRAACIAVLTVKVSNPVLSTRQCSNIVPWDGSVAAEMTSLLITSTTWKPSLACSVCLKTSVLLMCGTVTITDFSNGSWPQYPPNSGVDIIQGLYGGPIYWTGAIRAGVTGTLPKMSANTSCYWIIYCYWGAGWEVTPLPRSSKSIIFC